VTPGFARRSRRRVASSFAVLSASAFFAGAPALAQDGGGAEPAAAPATHTVGRVDLPLRATADGRVDSQVRRKVWLDPQAFGGQLEVAEVAVRSGSVAEGQALIRIDPTKIDEEIVQAEIALTNARRSHEFGVEELTILQQSNGVRMERATAAQRAAEQAFEIFDKYDGQKMLRGAELRLMQSEFSLADQREELAQLELMYEGSSLAGETKEIVLERNRRSIRMAEEYLQFTQNDLVIMRDYTYPTQKLRVENELRWASIELEHARQNTMMSEQNKRAAVEASARALADAEERLADLKSDRERFELAAPVSGVMTRIAAEPGDRVGAQHVFAEIVDPNRLIVTLSAKPEDLRVLSEGGAVTVTFPAFPEVSLAGTVAEIAPVGAASGPGTTFPVTIRLSDDNPLVRVGLNCSVSAESTLNDVLAVPAKCVHEESGKRYVHVAAGGSSEKREVTIGAKSDDMVQIVAGLREGDVVLLEKPQE
jgi:RND family efflux transporter MFP subunit